MRRALVLLATTVALLTTGAASGAGEHRVELTATGPQPTMLEVGWGDTVVFDNKSGGAATLNIPRLDVTTSIPAGGSFTQAFAVRSGSYRVRQLSGNRSYPATVNVAVTGDLTLQAAPRLIPIGRTVAVKGTSPYGGTPVELMLRLSGAREWTTLATVPAQVDGTYAASLRIARGGRIVAEAAGGQLVSDSFVLTVVPRIAVSAKPHRVKARSLVKVRAKIRPADAATRAFLDVYDVLRKRWRSSKDVGVSKTGVATFSLRVAKGTTRVRVRVPNSARVQGFAPVTSKPVTVVGFGCKNGGFYVLNAADGKIVAQTPVYTGKPALPLDPAPDSRMLALPGPLGGLQTGCATDGKSVFTNGLDALRLGTQETEAASMAPPTAGHPTGDEDDRERLRPVRGRPQRSAACRSRSHERHGQRA